MSTTDPLLLEVLRDNNETLRKNTEAVTNLRVDVANTAAAQAVAIGRIQQLEDKNAAIEKQLKELEGVAPVVKQVKKWLIWTLAFGLSAAIVGGIVLVALGKTLMRLLNLV